MKTRVFVSLLCGVLIAIASGCATIDSTRHSYIMRGQILDVTDDGVYLCIGSKDGAVVGQEYAVYRFTRTSNFKSPLPTFKKMDAGTVKLTEITDEHYAKARVIVGEAKIHDIVELKQ